MGSEMCIRDRDGRVHADPQRVRVAHVAGDDGPDVAGVRPDAEACLRAGVGGDDVDVTTTPDEQRVGVVALPVDDPLEGGGVLATPERGGVRLGCVDRHSANVSPVEVVRPALLIQADPNTVSPAVSEGVLNACLLYTSPSPRDS